MYILVNSTTSSSSLRKGGLSSSVTVYSIVYGVSDIISTSLLSTEGGILFEVFVDASEGDGVGSTKQV